MLYIKTLCMYLRSGSGPYPGLGDIRSEEAETRDELDCYEMNSSNLTMVAMLQTQQKCGCLHKIGIKSSQSDTRIDGEKLSNPHPLLRSCWGVSSFLEVVATDRYQWGGPTPMYM